MIDKEDSRKPAYCLLPEGIEGLGPLVKLALDMRWSWNHSADEIWQQLDQSLWSQTHNPWVILQTVSRDQFQKVMSDPGFRKKVDALVKSQHQANSVAAWFQQKYPNSPLTCVAYFSMEFMLSEALPIYSGGLGNVAGDQLKSASDLGVLIIGIGLLYQQGYFRQEIDKNGEQQALFPFNDPGQLPITPLRQPNGEWLRVEIALPGYALWLRLWQVQVGRIKLYLLDSNDAANFPAHRGITSELYGGGSELRFKQEILLGIGGWRLLNELGIKPQVCHLNEVHAAFAILERAYCYMKDTGEDFDIAMAVTRAGNVFTTHTAVAAGFDCFPPSLMEQFLGEYATKKLKITIQQLLALGRKDSKDESEKFNMAYLAIRGSRAINGVSQLHGEVSRNIFNQLFPNWPINEVPIGFITNGVHMPTWDSKEADDIWTEYCGKDRWLGTNTKIGQNILHASDEKLWDMRNNSKKSLTKFIRERFSKQLLGSGNPQDLIDRVKHLFDPNYLTLGFARRFATYKRPNLLLHDPERLIRLLSNSKYPIQLVISGKAHPADQAGKDLIKEWIQFIHQNNMLLPIVFISDYDIQVAENLVQGVDVWINTPRRPWEACGTSGMKVLVNGGINLSELDGWWAEAYNPELGWALGDGKEHGDDPALDALEAEQLYNIVEQQVIPEFYKRNEKGIPVAWISRMRKSMAQLTPQFSADRTVRDYTELQYLPAAKAFLERAANKAAIAKQLINWCNTLDQKWNAIRFGQVKVESKDKLHNFEIQIWLNEINPAEVYVELFADGLKNEKPIKQEMKCLYKIAESEVGYLYGASVSSQRPFTDYTARIEPHHDDLSIPLEECRILWQR